MLTNIFSLLRPLVLFFYLRAKNYSVVKSWSKSILNLVHLRVIIVATVPMTTEEKGARLTVNLPGIFVILHASRLRDPEIGIIQDIINLRTIGEDLMTTLGKLKNLTQSNNSDLKKSNVFQLIFIKFLIWEEILLHHHNQFIEPLNHRRLSSNYQSLGCLSALQLKQLGTMRVCLISNLFYFIPIDSFFRHQHFIYINAILGHFSNERAT